MAAETGNIYIFGIMTDGDEISTTNPQFSTTKSSAKCRHMIAKTMDSRKLL